MESKWKKNRIDYTLHYINGLVQDYGSSNGTAMELPQSCTEHTDICLFFTWWCIWTWVLNALSNNNLIFIQISLNFVLKHPTDSMSAFVQYHIWTSWNIVVLCPGKGTLIMKEMNLLFSEAMKTNERIVNCKHFQIDSSSNSRFSMNFEFNRKSFIKKLRPGAVIMGSNTTYRQVSNMRRTKSQHLKDSRTVLLLPLPNPLNPDIKSRKKM